MPARWFTPITILLLAACSSMQPVSLPDGDAGIIDLIPGDFVTVETLDFREYQGLVEQVKATGLVVEHAYIEYSEMRHLSVRYRSDPSAETWSVLILLGLLIGLAVAVESTGSGFYGECGFFGCQD